MKKCVIKLLSVMLVFVIFMSFLTIGNVVMAVDSDGEINLNVKFMKDSYLPGETAEAQLYISNAYSEKDKTVSGFSTRISFDSSLEFMSGEISDKLPEADLMDVEKFDEGRVILIDYAINDNKLQQSPDFDDIKGSNVTADTDEIMIAKLLFKVVQNTSAADVSLKFTEITLNEDTERYKSIVYNKNFVSYSLNVPAEPVSVDISTDKAKIEGGEFTKSGTSATASPYVAVNNNGNAYLIAKLYNKNTSYLAAPVIVKKLKDGANSFTGVDTLKFTTNADASDLEIRYYVWDTMTTMKPLTEMKTVNQI